jgi:hypothetical protein
MGKFITNFDTTAELIAFSATTDFGRPHVSLTKDDSKIHYFKDPYNGHPYVEIGGLKWATMNVGATSETDYGLYFQWGDTQGYTASQVGSGSGKKAFTWADYKYGNGTSSPGATGMTKYNATDGKTVLDIEDDAARANMGGQWRMPTIEELAALLYNAVNAVWTPNYNGSGVNGLLCTDKGDSSKKLFFPAAGRLEGGSMSNVGGGGYVWNSSLDSSGVNSASFLGFYAEDTWVGAFDRYCGFSVRGVVG